MAGVGYAAVDVFTCGEKLIHGMLAIT